MGLPQSKPSKRHVRHRKASHRYRGMQYDKCKGCGSPRIPHRVCPSCGHYGDRQIVSKQVE